jgi:hypothetical protein
MVAKHFKLVKNFNCEFGVLPAGSDILVLRGTIFVNDYQIQPVFYPLFHDLINKEMVQPNYLKEIPLPNSLSEQWT